MTTELITLRNSICESTRCEIQQQKEHQKHTEKAQRDKQFENLVNRLDNLRALAKSRNSKKMAKRRVQTSFAF